MFRSESFDPNGDLQDLTGKVVFVTGGNRGIGICVVKFLARKGAKVFLGARSEGVGKAAIEQLTKEGIGSGEVVWTLCDLSNPESVEKTAKELLEKTDTLDVLVLNAAMLSDPRIKHTEEILMVNHFGNFKLLQLLLPTVARTAERSPTSDVRVVLVSSDAHKMSRAKDLNIRFNDPDCLRQDFTSMNRISACFAQYAVSKLCQLLTLVALHKRYQHTRITFIAAHPGAVNTFSNQLLITRLLSPIINLFFSSPDAGAYNVIFAAASPKVSEMREKYNGVYLTPVGKIDKMGKNVTLELAEELYDTTNKFFDSPGMFPLIEHPVE